MIVDSFLYFNEKELADLRIKYLNDVVDSFVVIEANVTHQGKAKKWRVSCVHTLLRCVLTPGVNSRQAAGALETVAESFFFSWRPLGAAGGGPPVGSPPRPSGWVGAVDPAA